MVRPLCVWLGFALLLSFDPSMLVECGEGLPCTCQNHDRTSVEVESGVCRGKGIAVSSEEARVKGIERERWRPSSRKTMKEWQHRHETMIQAHLPCPIDPGLALAQNQEATRPRLTLHSHRNMTPQPTQL